jgi:hypothetical protein
MECNIIHLHYSKYLAPPEQDGLILSEQFPADVNREETRKSVLPPTRGVGCSAVAVELTTCGFSIAAVFMHLQNRSEGRVKCFHLASILVTFLSGNIT